METETRRLFERYERLFRQALAGDADMDEVASLYASDFIAASPAGVMSGRNDQQFRDVMARGYAHYRDIGTRQMRIRDIRIAPIDGLHCTASVAWTAVYARADLAETAIDFEVHYLVQVRQGEARVFGWVSGDEQALLKRYGVV